MKIVTSLFFAVEKDIVTDILSAATRLGLLATEAPGLPGLRKHFKVVAEDDDPAIQALCEYLDLRRAKWHLNREAVYLESELQDAPLLVLRLDRAPHGHGGPKYGTRYDLSSACPVCGSGARQISPLVLRRSDIPKRGQVIRTSDDEYLVNSEIARALSQTQLTGLRLIEAKTSSEGSDTGWFQLLPTEQMPPMAGSTRGIERWKPCPECGRDGHYHRADEPLQTVYSHELLGPDFPDVTSTYECFGKSVLKDPLTLSHFAQPMLLVRPQFRETFKAHRVRGISFDPVRLV